MDPFQGQSSVPTVRQTKEEYEKVYYNIKYSGNVKS